MTDTIVLLISLGIIIASILATWLYFEIKDRFYLLKRKVDYYEKTYLSHQGWSLLYPDPNGHKNPPHYHLKSWDAGQNWYAIDSDRWFDDGELIILGTAEEVYPKLLYHLDQHDKLSAHVKAKGKPVDLYDTEGIELLKSIGFIVKEN